MESRENIRELREAVGASARNIREIEALLQQAKIKHIELSNAYAVAISPFKRGDIVQFRRGRKGVVLGAAFTGGSLCVIGRIIKKDGSIGCQSIPEYVLCENCIKIGIMEVPEEL